MVPVVAKRLMAPGVADIEGSTHGHDVIPVKAAIKYLTARGYPTSMSEGILNNIKPASAPYLYIGSTKEVGANRVVFGEAVNLVLDKLSKEEAAEKVMVIDSEFIDKFRNLAHFEKKVISRVPLVSRLSTKSTLRCSFHPVSWNVETSQRPLVSVSTRTSSVSSQRSPLSLRWLSLRSPWLA